jgi:hypothetical protein
MDNVRPVLDAVRLHKPLLAIVGTADRARYERTVLGFLASTIGR